MNRWVVLVVASALLAGSGNAFAQGRGGGGGRGGAGGGGQAGAGCRQSGGNGGSTATTATSQTSTIPLRSQAATVRNLQQMAYLESFRQAQQAEFQSQLAAAQEQEREHQRKESRRIATIQKQRAEIDARRSGQKSLAASSGSR